MSDLLKEAIADAKAVRETALQNAKMALEEAFTPQLKNMLAAKLKQEDETLDGEPVVEDEEYSDEEEVEEVPIEDDEEESEEIPVADDEVGGDEGDVNINIDADDDDEEGPEEGVIEVNGVKYAPVVSEDDAEEDEFGDEDEVEIDEDNLDLESIIKELEAELSEEEDIDGDAVEESESSDEETVEEAEESSDETVEESTDEAKENDAVEEEYEIDEAELTEEDEESDTKDIQAELKEYKEAVIFLKDKLHEVNILNAKLLFTNKLFKEFALDNNQKLKVVETFDRTQSTREIKLVYSTLAEQFSDNGSINRKVNSIKESASSAVSSTKPSTESKKVISEENNVANRFKKLAGLINS